MTKKDFYRILQCAMMYFDEKTEIEINKHFNFQEMKKAKKIIEVFGVENE